MRHLTLAILILLVPYCAFGVSALPSQKPSDATTLIFLPQQQEIELALSAGPEHLRADATVYVFGKKGYEKVRSGKNGFTCMVNRDGNQSGDNDLKPTCWDPEECHDCSGHASGWRTHVGRQDGPRDRA